MHLISVCHVKELLITRKTPLSAVNRIGWHVAMYSITKNLLSIASNPVMKTIEDAYRICPECNNGEIFINMKTIETNGLCENCFEDLLMEEYHMEHSMSDFDSSDFEDGSEEYGSENDNLSDNETDASKQ